MARRPSESCDECGFVVVIARCDVQHCGNVLGVLLPKLSVCVVVSVPSILVFTLRNTCPRFNASNRPSLFQSTKMQFATSQRCASYPQDEDEEGEAEWEEVVKPREQWEPHLPYANRKPVKHAVRCQSRDNKKSQGISCERERTQVKDMRKKSLTITSVTEYENLI